jgi:hypothetical protein
LSPSKPARDASAMNSASITSLAARNVTFISERLSGRAVPRNSAD